ncbi:MAG: EAL domain-containing protein, partial [Desulfobulbaceae bacterium]|nr:EAL domain-containing protein [Desulfobulbaceae bacterium]
VRQGVSEQLHRVIVNKSPDLIYILDAKGCFQFINDRVEALLGYSKEELLGRPFNSLLVDSTITAKVIFNKYLEKEKTVTQEVQFNRKPDLVIGNLDPITVELTAMGVYYRDVTNGPNVFLGTYGVARDISRRKKVEARISYQAYHDQLTGLPNRTLFNDRLALAIKQARRDKGKLGVLFIDLDRFKTINDTLGHALGDLALQAITRRIENCIRQGDTLSRLGGDEFVLLMPRLKLNMDAASFAENILDVLQEPFCLGQHEVFITASIGIAVYPDHGEDADALMNHADMAMYEVKAQGRNRVGFYSPQLDKKYMRKLSFEAEMRRALERHEFLIEYQPQVTIGDRSIRGLEALVRWQHPKRGRLKPGDFIAEAEENGVILPLGNWVMEQVLRDVRNWRKQGIEPPVVAFNISALQFGQPNFATALVNLLEHYDVPGHCIELELTENVIMRDVNEKIKCLKKLTDAGIKIAIDDFGTGYTSLSNLQRLPVNTLKMDQSFVGGINASSGGDSMVSTIVAMAQGLGLGLIAEGVEKPYQAQYLEQAGCGQGQGYLFSTPLNYSSTVRYLEQFTCGSVQ